MTRFHSSNELKPSVLRAYDLYKAGKIPLDKVRRIGKIYNRLCKIEGKAYNAQNSLSYGPGQSF